MELQSASETKPPTDPTLYTSTHRVWLALRMDLLMRGFVTTHAGRLENTGSLSELCRSYNTELSIKNGSRQEGLQWSQWQMQAFQSSLFCWKAQI